MLLDSFLQEKPIYGRKNLKSTSSKSECLEEYAQISSVPARSLASSFGMRVNSFPLQHCIYGCQAESFRSMEVCSSVSAYRASERRSWSATCRHISGPASPVRTGSMATRRKMRRDPECLLHIRRPKRYDRENWLSELSTDSPFRTECKIFREDVWGKQLLTRAGVRAITWDPLKEADTLSLSLWKEWTGPAAFSIVFRALKKGYRKHERELIELGRKLSL